MDKPTWYLIWEEECHPMNSVFHREFVDKEGVNDFLKALRSDNVKYVKVISGFTLEERVLG